MKRFQNKTVMITGGAKGIGYAIAKAFARDGANLIIASRNLNALEEAKESIQKLYPEITVLIQRCDVSSEYDVKLLFNRVVSEFGSIHYLINNAACLIKGDVLSLSSEDWATVLSTNVTGSFLCAKEAFNLMKVSSEDSAIVNVSSLAGIRGVEKFPGMVSYITSKHAVVGLTESLAVEGRDYAIRVNAVAPGAVDTEMLNTAFPDFKAKTKPEDIAETFLYLCDYNQSGAMTGSILEIHCNV